MRMKLQQGRKGEKQKNTVTAFDRCQASCAPIKTTTYISYHSTAYSSLDYTKPIINETAVDQQIHATHTTSSLPSGKKKGE